MAAATPSATSLLRRWFVIVPLSCMIAARCEARSGSRDARLDAALDVEELPPLHPEVDRTHGVPVVRGSPKRWRDLYRGRAAVEREFGRLKHEHGLAPLRVRRLERVALHADLTMLARLSLAPARARAVPLAA